MKAVFAECIVEFMATGNATVLLSSHVLIQFGVRSLTSHPPTLEELFMRHYGDELAAEGIPLDAEGVPILPGRGQAGP